MPAGIAEPLFFAIAMIGTVAMSISAVALAARCDMDPFGAVVLATVASLGGGTLRDLLLGAAPVFWIEDLSFLYAVIPTAVLSIALVRRIEPGQGVRRRLLDYADALGLALFCVLGVRKSLDLGTAPLVAVLMGAITGIAGGMMRDVLCGQTPSVMRRDLYGSCALAGATVYVLSTLYLPAVPPWLNGLLAMAVVLLMRLYAIHARWSERQLRW